MTLAPQPSVEVVAFPGVASETDLATLGTSASHLRLAVNTQRFGPHCACTSVPPEHEPMRIVGVAPGDPVLTRLGIELRAGEVLVGEGHMFGAGTRVGLPGVSAVVVGHLPTSRHVLVTTFTDFTRMLAESPASLKHVITYAHFAERGPTGARVTSARSGWLPSADPLMSQPGPRDLPARPESAATSDTAGL